MCEPSNTLQLCTCPLGDDLPDNYWVLYSHVGEKSIEVIGEVVFPYDHLSKRYLSIHKFLSKVLNEEECFDKPIQFIKKDVLTITLKRKGLTGNYSFIYSGTKWRKYDPGPFLLENEYEEKEEGIVNSHLSENSLKGSRL